MVTLVIQVLPRLVWHFPSFGGESKIRLQYSLAFHPHNQRFRSLQTAKKPGIF